MNTEQGLTNADLRSLLEEFFESKIVIPHSSFLPGLGMCRVVVLTRASTVKDRSDSEARSSPTPSEGTERRRKPQKITYSLYFTRGIAIVVCETLRKVGWAAKA